MERYNGVVGAIPCLLTLLGCVYVTVLVGELRDLRGQCACCKEVADKPGVDDTLREADVGAQRDESQVLSYENVSFTFSYFLVIHP